jgi:FAD/FMN-containing dehydrogenase
LPTLKPQMVPMPDTHGFYVLTETSGSDEAALRERFERVLGAALEAGIIDDAVIAQSGSEGAELWHLRDMAIEVGRTLGHYISFDVSLRIADMDRFADELAVLARSFSPDNQTIVFGHAGDGNLHLAVGNPDGSDETGDRIERAVYDQVARYGGSISAEHGIGIKRREYLGHTRTAQEIAVMRTLKRALDPKNTLNPGRMLAG